MGYSNISSAVGTSCFEQGSVHKHELEMVQYVQIMVKCSSYVFFFCFALQVLTHHYVLTLANEQPGYLMELKDKRPLDGASATSEKFCLLTFNSNKIKPL